MNADQARRIVWRRLEEARIVKARLDAGTAFAWEAARLGSLIREARTYHRLAREAAPARRLPHPDSSLSYQVLCSPRSDPP